MRALLLMTSVRSSTRSESAPKPHIVGRIVERELLEIQTWFQTLL